MRRPQSSSWPYCSRSNLLLLDDARLLLIDRLFDGQKVAPGEPFLQRAPKKKSRVERRHGADFAFACIKGEPASPRFGDAVLDAEQRLRGWPAEANQDVRIGKFDLPENKRQADLRLLRCWCAVARRPPWYDVGNVNRGAVHGDRAQHAVEQLA